MPARSEALTGLVEEILVDFDLHLFISFNCLSLPQDFVDFFLLLICVYKLVLTPYVVQFLDS